jgi:hypothetical protein
MRRSVVIAVIVAFVVSLATTRISLETMLGFILWTAIIFFALVDHDDSPMTSRLHQFLEANHTFRESNQGASNEM